ncbi:hypothetical protein ACIQ2O_13385 [Serratia grimesii]|uniref:hypothetical protein n=1 Tax=Serratia grimesii TaxID=82995 RepID=UPI00383A14A6
MNKPSDNDLNKYLSKIKAVMKQEFKIKYDFGGEEVEETIKIDTLLYTDSTTGIEYGVTYVDLDNLCFTSKENPKDEQCIYYKDESGNWQLVL